MKRRKQNKQEKIQKFILVEKLKINELLQIRGGEGIPEDADFD